MFQEETLRTVTRRRLIHATASVLLAFLAVTSCSRSQNATAPAHEAQARQLVQDFLQKSLQNLPSDWYWKAVDNAPEANSEQEANTGQTGNSTSSFSVQFALQAPALDAAQTSEEAHRVTDQVLQAWERIGWKKRSDETKGFGHRFVSGGGPNGLQASMDIAPGSLLARCVVSFSAQDVEHSSPPFPRTITHDGPAS